MKKPIFTLVIPVFILGVWYLYNFGIYAFFFLYRIFGVYLLFFLISYFLKEKGCTKRLTVEWILVGLYIAFIVFQLSLIDFQIS